jgi:hypothetical protein
VSGPYTPAYCEDCDQYDVEGFCDDCGLCLDCGECEGEL